MVVTAVFFFLKECIVFFQNEHKMAATLRVVLGADSTLKLTLPTGIPDSVESLKGEIKLHFDLSGNFRLHYRDIEFDNDYVNLTTISSIRDKSTSSGSSLRSLPLALKLSNPSV